MAFGDEEAARLQHRKIAIEHLLLGLLRVEDSMAAKIMRENGADLNQLREKLAGAAPPTPALRVKLSVTSRSKTKRAPFQMPAWF